MPAAKTHIVLHDFHTVVDDETGKEKHFPAGSIYDGPAERLEVLLAGHDHKGPLVAEQSNPSPAAKPADAEVK
jgi:hypothetical protein